MKKINALIILCIISILVIFLVCFTNSTKNEKSDDNETSILTFKDISFVEETNISNISFYDEKYILANNVLYDLDGNILLDGNNYDHIKYVNGYVIVKKDNKYGVLGKDLKILIPIEYSNIEIMSNGCFFLEEVNKNNRILTTIYSPQSKKEYGPFIDANYFTDELIIVDKSIKNNLDEMPILVSDNDYDTYFLNIKNDTMVKKENYEDFVFSTSHKFQDNYVIVDKFTVEGYKTGIIDFSGKEIILFIYDEITNIEDRLLLMQRDNSYDIVNIDNKKILTTTDVVDIYLNENVISIEKDDEHFEYYDLNGKLIYETDTFSSINYVNHNTYILDAGDKCVYMDLSNNNINKKEIDYSYCSNFSGTSEKGYIIKENETGEMLCNNKLQPIFKNEYDSIHLYDNFCLVRVNNVYKIISYEEELLIDMEFKDYGIISDTEILLFDNEYNKYYFKY